MIHWNEAFSALNAMLVAYGVTIVLAMLAAVFLHGLGKLIVALKLKDLDAAPPAPPPAPAPVVALAQDNSLIAAAIAAAKQFHDTH